MQNKIFLSYLILSYLINQDSIVLQMSEVQRPHEDCHSMHQEKCDGSSGMGCAEVDGW